MAYLAATSNEYGVAVGVFRCDTCGEDFTICPKPADVQAWPNCLAPDCASYDQERDIDKWFDEGRVRNVGGRLVPIRVIEGGKAL